MKIEEIKFSLTKEKFILWFIIIPTFFLGIHLGIILTHILLSFSFDIPIFVRLTGIISSIWFLIGCYLYAKES